MSTTNEAMQIVSSRDMQRPCTKCGVMLSVVDKFCYNCGTRVEDLTATLEQNKAVSGPLASEYPSPLSRSPSSALAPLEVQESPVADLLAHYKKPSGTLRKLSFDLGRKLFHYHEYAKAADAFQQALLGNTDQPPMADILFYQALAYEKGGQYDRAFRTYLEAVLQAPQYFDVILLYLHSLLAPAIVLTQYAWFTEEWQKRCKGIALTKLNQAHIALLLGHMQLFRADYTNAQEQFKQAMRLAPVVVPTLTGELLAANRLPPALDLSSEDSTTHCILAQLLYTLQSYEHAMQETELALQFALADEDTDATTQAQQLKAQIQEKTGAKEEAAATYYELAVSLYSYENFADAVEMLRESSRLRPAYTPAYWYWADALLMQGYRAQSMKDKKAFIKEAIERWNTGFEQRPPNIDFAWAYITRALLCDEMRTALPGTIASACWWEAIAYLERALLLDKQNVYTWTYLGRYHRFLSNETNALETTQKAMDMADKDSRPYVLSDRAAILLDVGRDNEAQPLIEEVETNSWVQIVKALILFDLGDVNGAIGILNDMLREDKEKDEQTLWAHYVRAFCYCSLHDTQHANEDYDAILKEYKPSNVNDRENYAWAEYMRGDPRKAVKVYKEMLKDPAQDVRFSLGLCYLKLGKEDGKKYLLQAIRHVTNARQLDDLTRNLNDATANLIPANEEQTQAILEQARKAIAQQYKKVQHLRTNEEELRQVFKKYPYRSEGGTWAWIAARAGLGRLFQEQERWLEAIEMYRLLLKERKKFIEAHIGLEEIADKLCAEGDRRIEDKDFPQALEHYQLAQSFVPELISNDAVRLGNLYARLGFTYFALGDNENARFSFSKALESFRSGHIDTPGASMSEMCKSLLHLPDQYWALDASWQNWLSDPSLSEQLQGDLHTALSSLSIYLDDFFKFTKQSRNKEPPLLPIVLELGQDLIPASDSSEWPLFKTYLPNMCQRIKTDIGIEDLFTWIRDNQELAGNEYRILLDEIPISRSEVVVGGRFSPVTRDALEALGIAHDALVDAPDPVTGKMGCWVTPEHYQDVLDHNQKLWDEPLIYVVFHLENLLRNNLSWFLGTEEAEWLVQSWEQEKHPSPADSALADAETRFYFLRVLRALVREQVPIHQWEDILHTVTAPNMAKADGKTTLQAVRTQLRRCLPGNRPLLPRVELPSDLEQQLAAGMQLIQDKADASLYLPAIMKFYEFIQALASKDGWSAVLVTHNTELRFIVRWILENFYPSLMVLAQEEALAEERGTRDI